MALCLLFDWAMARASVADLLDLVNTLLSLPINPSALDMEKKDDKKKHAHHTDSMCCEENQQTLGRKRPGPFANGHVFKIRKQLRVHSLIHLQIFIYIYRP